MAEYDVAFLGKTFRLLAATPLDAAADATSFFNLRHSRSWAEIQTVEVMRARLSGEVPVWWAAVKDVETGAVTWLTYMPSIPVGITGYWT